MPWNQVQKVLTFKSSGKETENSTIKTQCDMKKKCSLEIELHKYDPGVQDQFNEEKVVSSKGSLRTIRYPLAQK
jgi:hypothetical protein